MWALMVLAFVDGDFFAHFPGEKRFKTIWAGVLGMLAKTNVQLKNITADLAFQLRTLLAIVEINIDMRCITMWAACAFRNTILWISDSDRFEHFAMFGFIFHQKCFKIHFF